jgi:hypothetical protein
MSARHNSRLASTGTSILASVGISTLLIAQTPIVPAWSHQWSFGQDPELMPAPIPVSLDNRVAVDASNGNVYITIDDQLEQYGPRFDQLHRFASDGTDLTPQQVPLLGNVPPNSFSPNVESTRDLVVRNGTIFHQRELALGFASDGTAGNLCATDGGGTRWRLGLGHGYVGYGGMVLVDDVGVVIVRPTQGTFMHAVDHGGWITWSTAYASSSSVRDAVLVGNTIVVLQDGSFLRFDRNTGASLGPAVPLFGNGVAHAIASDGSRLFFAYTDFTGNSTWSCAQLDGTVLWTHSIPSNYNFTEMVVDSFGRPWLIGNPTTGGEAPLLIVTGSDGNAYETFTFGTSMNDIAMGDGQAYLTGRLDNATSTYLIAISTDLTTSVETVAPATSILYPQPASSNLNVGGGSRLKRMRVLDATGKVVQVPFLTTATLDVSGLSEGIYFLEADGRDGRVTKRFVIAR